MASAKPLSKKQIQFCSNRMLFLLCQLDSGMAINLKIAIRLFTLLRWDARLVEVIDCGRLERKIRKQQTSSHLSRQITVIGELTISDTQATSPATGKAKTRGVRGIQKRAPLCFPM